MSEKETGGPAFPQPYQHMEQAYKLHRAGQFTTDELTQTATRLGGMTLRDYFAGQAMLADVSRVGYYQPGDHMERAAKNAYAMADAMLEARK